MDNDTQTMRMYLRKYRGLLQSCIAALTDAEDSVTICEYNPARFKLENSLSQLDKEFEKFDNQLNYPEVEND